MEIRRSEAAGLVEWMGEWLVERLVERGGWKGLILKNGRGRGVECGRARGQRRKGIRRIGVAALRRR